MRFLASEQISEHRYKTPEGYLVCLDCILARTGKQTYLRKEIFGDSCKDGDQTVEVTRKEQEVFDPKAIASFENKPIVVEHPDEDVNPENHRDYAVGFVRDVKQGEYDGEKVLRGTLVITDQEGIDAVESGKYVQLSCGYDCDIQDTDSPEQKNIRGNHVALCEEGRAGIARVIDSVNDSRLRVGSKVDIKSPGHWADGEWGIVYGIDGDDIYVGVAGDDKTHLLFSKKELKVRDEDNHEFFYKAAANNNYYVSVDPAKIKQLNPKSSNVWILEQKGNDFVDMIGGKAKYNAGEIGSKSALDNYLRKKGNCIKLDDSELKDVNPREGESKDDFIARFMSETKEEYPDEKQRLAVAYSYWEENKKMEDAEKTFVIVQSVMGSNYKVTLWESDTAEHALAEFLEKNPQWARRKLKAIHYNEWKGTALGKDEQVEDAMKTYQIHWIDLYEKQQGYAKQEYAHRDEIKASSVDDALQQLGKRVALAGVGTANTLVTSVRNDDKTYMFSGRLSDLLKKSHQDSAEKVEDEFRPGDDVYHRPIGGGRRPAKIVRKLDKREVIQQGGSETDNYYEIEFDPIFGKHEGRKGRLIVEEKRLSKDSIEDDFDREYAKQLRMLEQDVEQMYKLFKQGDKAPSTILRNMGYKQPRDNYFTSSSGQYTAFIKFDDYSDYIEYGVTDRTGQIPRGWTVTKMKFYDSFNDSKKVREVQSGFVIVRADAWNKYGSNAYIEAAAKTIEEARFLRDSLERNDHMKFVIIDVEKRMRVDSVKDKLIDPPQSVINEFERKLKENHIRIVGKGKTMFGRNHYQVEYDGTDRQLHETLKKIDNWLRSIEIPMTWSIGYDKNGQCTAGLDLDKQYVEDSCKKDSWMNVRGTTSQGYEVRAIYNGKSGRLYAVIYRPRTKDFVVAAGYHQGRGDWDQGYYDFDSEDKARKFAEKHARLMGDSCKKDSNKLYKINGKTYRVVNYSSDNSMKKS